jgi:hypothetical protein
MRTRSSTRRWTPVSTAPSRSCQQKHLRAELLSVKTDLERELKKVWLNCVVCGVPACHVGGLGVRAGHWAHAAPAPHETPKVAR